MMLTTGMWIFSLFINNSVTYNGTSGCVPVVSKSRLSSINPSHEQFKYDNKTSVMDKHDEFPHISYVHHGSQKSDDPVRFSLGQLYNKVDE
jgi:hypothetical protein